MILDRDNRLHILSEGQKYGVSPTCKKFSISRTLYYRWLKRYQSFGIQGLEDVQRSFKPVNKTETFIEVSVLDLIKAYPAYGPKALHYLLEEIGHPISESAVYNIMKRHNLNKRDSRLKFARAKTTTPSTPNLDFDQMASGACWVFWLTDLGTFPKLGPLYLYTFYDLKSRIACSRLYKSADYKHFENLMDALALPIARSLHFDINYLCLHDQTPLAHKGLGKLKGQLEASLEEKDLDTEIHWLSKTTEPSILQTAQEAYTSLVLSFLVPMISTAQSVDTLKLGLQQFVRDYNMDHQQSYDTGSYPPVIYHNHILGDRLALPLWAYLDRHY